MRQVFTLVGADWQRKPIRIPGWLYLLLVLLPFGVLLWGETSWAQAGTFCIPTGDETIQTNKQNYTPDEDVYTTGTGFAPLCDVYVRVTRPNGTVLKGDGTSTPGMDVVTTDEYGNLASAYIRQGSSISGEHVVDVLDGEINVVSSTIFHNPEPPSLPSTPACLYTVDASLPVENPGAGDFKTIQSAVGNLPNPGPCTINVLPGTYNEFVNLGSKNTMATDASQEISFQATAGSVIVAPISSNAVGFTLTNSRFISISGFTVTGTNVARGFSLSSGTGNTNADITIEGNIVFDVGTAATAGSAGIVVGAGNPRTWIVNNLLRNNHKDGIDLSNGSGPSYVINNTIYQSGWNGVMRASGGGTNAIAFLINNLVVGNGIESTVSYGRWGIYQSGSGNSSQATLLNNMFYQNGIYSGGALTSGGDISGSGAGILDAADGNNYTTNGGPTTGIVGCTFADCLATHAFAEIFTNTTDLVLLKTPPQISPAIDMGQNTFFDGGYEWVPAQDLYGGSRILDGDEDGTPTADIGCNEAPGSDSAPPETIIDGGPTGYVSVNSATFTFHATEPGSTFLCQLDGNAVAACDSRTVTYSGLGDGSHTFQVWATDMAGNADPTPASRSWTIDTVPPDTVVDTTPPLSGNTNSATFTFHATEIGSTFECSLDSAPFAACSTPKTYAALADGNHLFRVRAIDPAGNPDAAPAGFTWSVSNFPDTSITVGPTNPSNSGGAVFGFSSTKAGSTFECRLDGASFLPCANPATFSSLPDGSHTFAVRAVDTAGNADPSPAAFSWTIDTAPPNTIIDNGPVNPLDLNSATFGFHSSEGGGAFECSLDGSPFSSCSSPKSYPGMVDGSHTFQVRAGDLAGNIDPSPASLTFNWSVDTSTLTVVQNDAKQYADYNQTIYLAATVTSSAGQVNEGNVTFTITQAGSTVIGPIISPPVTGGAVLTYATLPAGTPAGIYSILGAYSGGSNYKPGTGTGTLVVTVAPATVSLGNLTQNYDGTPKPVTVSTNPAGIAVSVTYNGSTTPPTNPGSYSVVASLNNPNYAGPDAAGVLTIAGKAIPSITWSDPADIVYPTPLSDIQANATADVPGTFSYTPPAGTVLGAGVQTLRVDFTPTDTANYMSTFKTVQITVLSGNQTIVFEPLAGKTFGDPDFALTAIASSGLPVTFAATGNCEVAGGIVRITGAGSCAITASQGGDSSFHPALDVVQPFPIAKASAVLSLSSLAQIYDGLPKTVAADTDPPGLFLVAITYDGSSTPPTEAGIHAVVASLENPDFQAPDASGTLTILRAEAGSDQTVDEGTAGVSVGSTLSYGTTYSWVQIAGPPAALSDPTSPMQSLPALLLDGGFGSQVVTLELTASGGGLSTSDTVNITVKNVNHAPVADPGTDQTVNEDAPVTLSGIHSYDPDGDPVTYQWVQTGGPAVTITAADNATAMFTSPLIPGGFGGSAVLTFQLAVSDGALSDTKPVKVTIEQVNHPPTADAGTDQTTNEGSPVTLNGGGMDPDGDPLSYAWTQIGGPPVTLSSSQSAAPSFTAPTVEPGGATLEFQLVVNDGLLGSQPDNVAVTILNVNDPPACSIARAGQEDLWPPNHKLVPVGITGVADPNNDAVWITVTGVTQDEPTNGLGDGDTGPDAVIQEDKVLLRAERSGSGNGRVYRVSFTADDGNGGICTGSVRVGVPPNKKPNVTAIDDGQVHISTNP